METFDCEQTFYLLKPSLDNYEYRDFMIHDDSYKQKVDEFYIQANNDASIVNGEGGEIFNDLSYKQLEDKLKMLYSQEDKWIALNTGVRSESVIYWAKSIKNAYVKIVKEQLTMIESLYMKSEKCAYCENEILRIQIEYDKILKSPLLGFNIYRQVSCKKALSFMRNEGFASNLLIFANFYPELVQENVYPIIDYRTGLYLITDIDSYGKNPIFATLFKKYGRFMYTTEIRSIKYIDDLETVNEHLLKHIEDLENELRYRPEGDGYLEAKKDFEKLSKCVI